MSVVMTWVTLRSRLDGTNARASQRSRVPAGSGPRAAGSEQPSTLLPAACTLLPAARCPPPAVDRCTRHAQPTVKPTNNKYPADQSQPCAASVYLGSTQKG